MPLRILEFAVLADRLVLAGVFLLAGATKFIDPSGFRKTLSDFGIAPVLARPAMVLLPLLELAVAAALIPVGFVWYGAWGALALLSVFCLAAAVAMLRGRRPKCHCFGQLHSTPLGWSTWIRNAALAACAALLIARGPLHPGPDLWAWFVSLHGSSRKAAIIVLCIAAFGFIHVLDRARPAGAAVALQSAADSNDSDDDEDEAPQARPAPARRVRRRPPLRRPRPESPGGGDAVVAGLARGAAAPEFELPGMNGEKRSLSSLREGGRDVLLVFTSPYCEACMLLAANLPGWMRGMSGLPRIVFISTGSAEANLAKMRGFEPGAVLLQRHLEVSEAYGCTTTPTAILVGADGMIRSDQAMGAPGHSATACIPRGGGTFGTGGATGSGVRHDGRGFRGAESAGRR